MEDRAAELAIYFDLIVRDRVMSTKTNLLARFGILAAALGVIPAGAFAQDDPNAAERAQMETQQQGGRPGGLTPSMGIVPGAGFPTNSGPANSPRMTPPVDPGPDPTSAAPEHNNDSFRGGRGTGGGNRGGYDGGNRGGNRGGNGVDNNRGPRDETFRNPDLNYRNRPPRWEEHDHNPRPFYRPPPVIVRPYYQPPIIVRPYYAPPVFEQPYYAPPRQWGGPVPGNVVWDLFPGDVYTSLTINARLEHERAFVAALSSGVGQTQAWRWGNMRGDVTVIDESYFGSSYCRDVVQTIRTPWFGRTVDGRVCIRPGQAWRLVSY